MKAIRTLMHQDTPFLDPYRNRIIHIIFLVAFTLVFLTVYSPFNMNEWGGDIAGYLLIGSSVIIISQFPLRILFGFNNFKLYQLVIWGLAEIIAVAFFIYIIFGVEFEDINHKLGEFLVTLKFVGLVIVGPYFLSVWFLAGKQQRDKVLEGHDLTETEAKDKLLLSLTDEKGKVIFAIQYEQLLFIKSSGNYLEFYYLKGDTLTKELLRMSLVKLESSLANPIILRIHRSYLVNKNRISSFKKSKKGYDVFVQNSSEVLPVSSGYKDDFEMALTIKSSH